MIQLANGTLEGTGPNKLGTTSGSTRDLNYNSITDNASTSPATQMLGNGGPNKLNDTSSPLVNMVNGTNDTAISGVDANGTLEGSGPNA